MNRINQLYEWLDNRTGLKGHIREALFENVPGGSRWRYVWGSTLTFTLMIQFITGVFLWIWEPGFAEQQGERACSYRFSQCQ